MARLLALCLVLLVAAGAMAAPIPPITGAGNNEWSVVFRDDALGTTWGQLGEGGTFTQVAADTFIYAGFAYQSVFDSLRSGNGGVGTLTGVYTFATSADETANLNFFKTKSGTVSYITAPFSTAASPLYNAYLMRNEDTDFRLGATWAVAVVTGGFSAGNPGVGKVQEVFSFCDTPNKMAIGFNAAGKVYGLVSDSTQGGFASSDSIVSATDVYNSAYHVVVFSCASSTLTLRVDNQTALTKSLTHAKQTLTPLDTLNVLGGRAGANDFRGRIDELYLTESAAPLGAAMMTYFNRRFAQVSGSDDSAAVRITGFKASDSTIVTEWLKIPTAGDTVTAVEYSLFQSAYADSDETEPIIVWADALSPRAALLDSIPANAIHAPQGIVTFGKKDDYPVFLGAEASKMGTADTAYVEVRCYPDWKDARAPTTGYYVLWQGILTDGESNIRTDREVLLPRPSYLAVYGRANNATGSGVRVSVWGKRSK